MTSLVTRPGVGVDAPASRTPQVVTQNEVRPLLGLLVTITSTLGLVAIVFAAFGYVFSGMQQSSTQRGLYAELRSDLALATAPIGGVIAPGRPVAVLTGLGMSQTVVVEGTTSGILRAGPGHRRDTPLPGQAGVSVLYGKSVTYGAPFAGIAQAAKGAVLSVTTGQGVFRYEVEGVRRQGDPLPAVNGGARLTLVTSEGQGAMAGWAADSAVFVDAVLKDTPQPAPVGRLAGIGPTEKAMASDRTALVPLVFSLQALLLLGLAVAWSRVRWGVWQTWLVAGPLVIALAWFCADTAFVLLPNLL